MRIKIFKAKGIIKYKYIADCLDLPGSPPIGYGDSKKEAVGNLFLKLIPNILDTNVDITKIEWIE